MRSYEITTKLFNYQAMAIVRTDSFEKADEIARACIEAEIPVMELSLNSKDALEIIKKLKYKYQDKLLCGAGTVLDEVSARLAILARADFIIAPNFDKKVAKMCNLYDVVYGPGVSSASEATEAKSYGATFIKAFPISNFYGENLIKVFKTPLPQIAILASGGIDLNNLENWLKNGADICAFGSLLSKGSYEDILENAKKIKAIISNHKLKNVK